MILRRLYVLLTVIHPLTILTSRYTYLLALLLVAITLLPAQLNHLNQGNQALKNGDFETAASLYQKAIDNCGEDYKGNHNLAILAAKDGDTDLALHLLGNSIKSNNATNAYYNRAIILLSNNNYQAAIEDLKIISNERYTGKLEQEAIRLKAKAIQKQVLILDKLGDQQFDQGQYDSALKYYGEAEMLSNDYNYYLFKKAQVGLAQKNPFVSLENAEAIEYTKLTEVQKLEVDLIKAYSLGRINRIKEGVAILENLLYHKKYEDPRLIQMLGYYYLRLGKHEKALNTLRTRSHSEANTYVIAGNAALYLKKYGKAAKCFQYALQLDPANTNAEIGRALCLASNARHSAAIAVIDALAKAHPDNFRVLNTKGIVYKDLGLYYKNRHNNQKSKSYLLTSEAAFLSAQKINETLAKAFESNRALALFFLNKNAKAKKIWQDNNELSSQNNLALCYASEKDYKTAYKKLESLSSKFISVQKKKHRILEYNKDLARSRTRLNNNYKFITNYFLTQDKPEIEVENPFDIDLEDIEAQQATDFILEYSDEDCSEQTQVDRKKKKKKKFRLFKKRKKKYKGDCPSF